jgi:predicted transcriptional regulator
MMKLDLQKELRQLGMSKAEFIRATGISSHTLTKVIRDPSIVRPSILDKIKFTLKQLKARAEAMPYVIG